MRYRELVEGMMKRSHPVISGEMTASEFASRKTTNTAAKKSSSETKFQNIANQAHVSVSEVRKAFDYFAKQVDPNHPNYWAIVTNMVKRHFKISK